jgi:DNA recombination protein RmuC
MMNDLVINFLIIVFGISIGLFIGRLLGKLKGEKEKSVLEGQNSLLQSSKENAENTALELQKELKFLQQEKERLLALNSGQEADLKNMRQKVHENKDEVDKIQEKFTKEFENLANKILEDKSKKFTEQNKENIQTILNPLQEKIKGFEDKVDKTHKESIDYHAALRQQIVGLKEMNLQMSKETIN